MKKFLLTVILAALLLAPPAGLAYIEKMYPFQDVLNESQTIVVGKITKVDIKAKTAVATFDRALKGKLEFQTVLMNIGLGPAHQAQYLIEKLKPDAPVILYYQRSGNEIVGVAHSADHYFQLYATDTPADRSKVWWRMSHVEVAMGRTFNGKTPDLIQLTADVLDKKVKPPAPDPTVPRMDLDHLSLKTEILAGDGKTGGFRRQFQFRHEGGAELRGLCWADINGDDMPDVLLCRQSSNVLMVNAGGSLQDVTGRSGLTGGARGACWGDYDCDGNPDLLTSNFQIFTNIGGGVFRDDSRLLTPPAQRDPRSAAWIDYDGDCLPDALVSTAQGLRLYRNLGKGLLAGREKPADARNVIANWLCTLGGAVASFGPAAAAQMACARGNCELFQQENRWFADVTESAGLDAKTLGVAGDYFTCFDFDNDGWTDILLHGPQPILLRNVGGKFVPVGNCGLTPAGPATLPRGLALGDFDNDGFADVAIPGSGRVQLFHNNRDGTFTDVSAATGDLAKRTDPSVSVAWGDINGDGNLDLLVCQAQLGPRVYLGSGKGGFTDVTDALGLKDAKPASAGSFIDVNADGKPDLVLNSQQMIVVALNEIEQPASRGVLRVVVSSKRGLTGAVIRVLDDRGRTVAIRPLLAAEGLGGSSCAIPSFMLPAGKYTVSACLSDGRAAVKSVTVSDQPVRLAIVEDDLK